MVDGGVALERDRAELVSKLKPQPFGIWEPSALAALKEGTSATAKGIPLKRVYGSDFPYRECDEHLPATYQGVGVRPSLAFGGLSNVWGSAMLPFREPDMKGWPLAEKDLAPHYGAVLKFTGLSARHDALEKFFPLYDSEPLPLNLSNQASILMRRLSRHEQKLERKGIHFGQARMAVRASNDLKENGCVYCGLCMYGCAYGHIYNSAETVAEMQSDERFEHRPGLIVTGVTEHGDTAEVQGYLRETREPFSLSASRVYLAAGSIPTTRILLRSQNIFDQPVRMKDSQYFLCPILLARGAGAVQQEQLHTLSQIFLELFDSKISPYGIHIQLYTYNDLIGQAVRGAMGRLAKPLSFLARAMEGRLLVMQGYLHSDHSAQIALTLRKSLAGQERQREVLDLRPELNPATKPIIKKIVRKLAVNARVLGGAPLIPMLRIAEPGRGFHTGATFPMSSKPGQRESDILGRPFGWKRVHVVDSTVLPSIPATTITFSVMANAHRIACATANAG
jgi:choline dehydrogenase-like flavoprotein